MRGSTRRDAIVRLLALGSALPFGVGGIGSAERKQGTPLLYYSDYYSFVGRDERGRVYLALDNNRGRDGDAYQADHWATMYDEETGWIEVAGSAHYENSEKILDRIPDSPDFTFRGSPEAGVRMASATNGMEMTVAPLSRVLQRENADGIFWIGGAAATLQWRDRRLAGRVIFEYLQRYNWNRFTGDFESNWKNFNGLYLLTDRGHDFYLHSHDREGGSDLTGKLVGMASWDTPAPVTDIDFAIVASDPAASRAYRWPAAWRVGFTHQGQRYQLDLATRDRRLFSDWDTGGFAMAIVAGTIARSAGGDRVKVVGWGELLI